MACSPFAHCDGMPACHSPPVVHENISMVSIRCCPARPGGGGGGGAFAQNSLSSESMLFWSSPSRRAFTSMAAGRASAQICTAEESANHPAGGSVLGSCYRSWLLHHPTPTVTPCPGEPHTAGLSGRLSFWLRHGCPLHIVSFCSSPIDCLVCILLCHFMITVSPNPPHTSVMMLSGFF